MGPVELTWFAVWVSMGVGVFIGVILASVLGIGRLVDDADRSDGKIEAFNQIGVEEARKALRRPQLLPIGACHYCGSTIAPRHLFCPTDEIEPEQSCAIQWEHEQKCRRLNNT
jgi:hypothetical protein